MGRNKNKKSKQKFILAVDTTTFSGSVAILEGAKLVAEVNARSSATFSERLLPAVELAFISTGLTLQDVDVFAVAVGPGSFTGIRIGLSTVKSFAHASGKPVAPVSSLAALARKLQHPPNRLICPLLDAKKNEIYSALFESSRDTLQEIVPQGAYSPDGFFSLLPPHRIIHFIGNGVEAYGKTIFRYFKDKARFSKRSPFIAFEVGLIGYEMIKKGKGRDSHLVEPLYLRKSQAEGNH